VGNVARRAARRTTDSPVARCSRAESDRGGAGNLRRAEPHGTRASRDRGTPVDRVFIERDALEPRRDGVKPHDAYAEPTGFAGGFAAALSLEVLFDSMRTRVRISSGRSAPLSFAEAGSGTIGFPARIVS
jgi:hypothetical protein